MSRQSLQWQEQLVDQWVNVLVYSSAAGQVTGESKRARKRRRKAERQRQVRRPAAALPMKKIRSH